MCPADKVDLLDLDLDQDLLREVDMDIHRILHNALDRNICILINLHTLQVKPTCLLQLLDHPYNTPNNTCTSHHQGVILLCVIEQILMMGSLRQIHIGLVEDPARVMPTIQSHFPKL
jgi:hypothetical protein